LLHEVHHVVLGHLTHPKFRDVTDRDAMSMAMEMSANEYIEEPLPDPIVWKAYERFGLRAGQSTMERYETLSALRRGRGGSLQVPKGTVDDHGPWERVPMQQGAVEATRKLIQEAIEATQSSQGDSLKQATPKRRRLAGKDPGRLIEELIGTAAAPEIEMDWKTALAMFIVKSRAPVHTYARPNRRFPRRVGEVPGRSYSPRVIERPHLLVAIDTSSSMDTDELAEVARQLTRVSEHARITIVECDTEIQSVYPFAGRIDQISGRGGTDLRPVFATPFLASHRVDGIVYFTDGEGPHADRAPSVPTLWVLTKSTPFACPWGARVVMSTSANARTQYRQDRVFDRSLRRSAPV
jgi:predicted metal-dependent peptidase